MTDPPGPAPRLSVIVPASNEAGWIATCLQAVLASEEPDTAPEAPPLAEVIVVANGCTDATAALARDQAPVARRRGWALQVIELPEGNKIAALNAGDAAARAPARVYLDADVVVSPPLLAQLAAALDRPQPAYASGTPQISTARSAITRAYARFWVRLPFVAQGVPGFGVFAVNGPGRARWGAFPQVISDDTFARVQFSPAERLGVPAPYVWPMVEGARRLIRVRRRQDAGVAEIAARWPHLMANEGKARPGAGWLARAALRDPVGFAVYAAIGLAVRLTRARDGSGWDRGR